MPDQDEPTGDQPQSHNAAPTSLGNSQIAATGGENPKPAQGGNNPAKDDKPPSIKTLWREIRIIDVINSVVGVGILLVAIAAYLVASDTGDLKQAVQRLSTVAAQSTRQANASAGQLLEMRREQRPWVSVKIITDAPATLMKIGDNFEIKVRYRMENVGKLPASRVFFYVKLIAEGDPSNFKNDISDACRTFIEIMNEDVNSAGITIFPGQLAESDFGSDETPISDFTSFGSGHPAMLLAVCAAYRFDGDGNQFHFTPAAYVAGIRTKKSGIIVRVDPAHFPVTGIRMQIAPLAQGNLGPT